MEISTSTNLCAFRPDGGKNGFSYCIKECAAGGYRVLDLNLCEAMNPTSRLRTEPWQAYGEDIARWAEEAKVTFAQAHLPYYDLFAEKDASRRELMEKLIRRAILVCGMLQIPWAVTHPGTVYEAGPNMSVSLRRNLDYYSPLVDLASAQGVGIALENDFEYLGPRRQRVFCAAPGELADLVDAFHAPEAVGACYDFGHANLVGGFHREDLLILGKRLKAVHINDNHGQKDEHLLPFLGTVNWATAMAALAEIDYTGPLTYEIQEYGRNFPNAHKHLAVAESLRVGEILCALYAQGKTQA